MPTSKLSRSSAGAATKISSLLYSRDIFYLARRFLRIVLMKLRANPILIRCLSELPGMMISRGMCTFMSSLGLKMYRSGSLIDL